MCWCGVYCVVDFWVVELVVVVVLVGLGYGVFIVLGLIVEVDDGVFGDVDLGWILG